MWKNLSKDLQCMVAFVNHMKLVQKIYLQHKSELPKNEPFLQGKNTELQYTIDTLA